MAGYVKKTLLQNERIIYTAEGHVFNYVTSVIVILIGLIMSGILEPKVPQELRKYEVVNEISKDINRQVAQITRNVDNVQRKVQDVYETASRRMSHDVGGAVGFVSKARYDFFGFMFLFVGFINLLRQYVHDKTTEFCVTTKRIVHKFGFLTTDTREINLDRVEGVKVRQNIIDKLIGRGDVIVNGIGMEQVEMERVSSPSKLRAAILEAVNRYTQQR